MPPKRTGLSRLIFATGYSIKGLKAAFASEAAIRQECIAMLVLIPCAFYLDIQHQYRNNHIIDFEVRKDLQLIQHRY